MIGSLTIEKANLNISYMLASLKILSDAGGSLSRSDFILKMADFMECTPETEDGKENRVPYNKTKFDRYFGFMDVKANGDLCITPRGDRLIKLVVENQSKADPSSYYNIDPTKLNLAQELFLDSCCFDSFGSYNCGAETSNSDIEPPRVILKTVSEIGSASKFEIGYVLWGLDVGVFDSFADALDKVLENRNDPTYDYTTVIKSWNKINFVNDFKMLDLLSNNVAGLLEENFDGWFELSPCLSQEARWRISMMAPIAFPIQMILNSDYGQVVTLEWVRNSILGRIADTSMIFHCDASMNGLEIRQIFARAISKAYDLRKRGAVDDKTSTTHQNCTVTLVVSGLTNGVQSLEQIFPGLGPSFQRKNDFKAANHGWTLAPGKDHILYEKLVSQNDFPSQFGIDNIVFPSNLNIIGVK